MAEFAFDLSTIAANLVTEDDEPVDNLFSEKQQRFLAEALTSSWQPPPNEETPDAPRKFLAAVNVGIFYSVIESPLVPDMFLSLDVEPNAELFADEHRSYFVWTFGKVPEVAVEIVSNRKGGEMDKKLKTYARWSIDYYVVFDPFGELGGEKLNVYEIGFGKRYVRRNDFALPELGLSLQFWQGEFEGAAGEWLRWCDADGNLLLIGDERAKIAEKRAGEADERANKEAKRAEKLAAKLREMGVDPEQI